MKLKFLLLLLVIPAIIIPVFAIPAGESFESFCDIKTNNLRTTAADFICELDIFEMNDRILSLEEKTIHYSVTVNETAQVGERFDITAMCDSGDFMYYNVAEYNTYPEGYSGGSGNVMGSLGNTDHEILIGKILNLNNRDNVETDFPVVGELIIACVKSPIP